MSEKIVIARNLIQDTIKTLDRWTTELEAENEALVRQNTHMRGELSVLYRGNNPLGIRSFLGSPFDYWIVLEEELKELKAENARLFSEIEKLLEVIG